MNIYGAIEKGKFLKAGKYTLSYQSDYTAFLQVWLVDNMTQIVKDGSEKAITFTLPSDGKYSIYFYKDTTSEGGLANANIRNLQLEKSNEATPYTQHFKTTLLIPDSDRNLPCFGYGIDETVQNIRDYENGTYTQMVTELRLGDIDKSNYTIRVSNGSIIKFGITIPIPYLIHNPGIINPYTNLITNNYDYNGSSSASYNVDESDGLYTYDGSSSASGNKATSTTLYYLTHDITKTIDDAMNDLADTVIVFEIAEPIVTDMSDDMLMPIRCESGGTITLVNEHNLDMPNTVVYKKEVSLNG